MACLVHDQLIRMADRDRLTGDVFALLVRVGIGHEFEKRFAEIEIVNKRCTLCGCTGAGDPLPFSFLRDTQPDKRAPKRSDPVGKIFVEEDLTCAQRHLGRKTASQLRATCRRLA